MSAPLTLADVPDSFERFELGLLGGALERQYRRMRPEVERLPWGSLAAEVATEAPSVVEKARRIWTMAAFQEYRTGASCTTALRLLLEASAPLDLVAVATRFPLDEIVHVELCARLLAELGGAAPLLYEPDRLGVTGRESARPLLRSAEVVMRVFCVGEAVSIPILRASARHARQPLIRAVLQRIVKDEAAHGRFGWYFLDWAGELLTEAERQRLRWVARDEIDKLLGAWQRFAEPSEADMHQSTLGWMDPKTYFRTAHAALDSAVLGPLAARGLDPRDVSPIARH